MFGNKIALSLVFIAVVGLVFALPAPGSENVLAVCRGDGTYPITKVTDLLGRTKYFNQNNEKIEIPSWCDLEEDTNGNYAVVSGSIIASRSGV